MSLIQSAFAQSTPPAPAGAGNAAPAPGSATTSSTTTAPAPGAVAPAQPSPLMSFLPFLLMFGVIYFLIIRPQQRKMKEHQVSLEKLKHGDEVVTQGGIFGTITGITDKVITLEVDKNVKLKILKSQIATVVSGKEAPKA